MFKAVLVPLDGSAFAEQALTPAFAVAQKFDGEVILLRVILPEELPVRLPSLIAAYPDLLQTNSNRGRQEAQAYLSEIRTQWFGSGIPIRPQVVSGVPPEMITTVAKVEGVDLIVMSTHGRSGFSRVIYGSVAEAVLRGAHVPVLLIPNTYEVKTR